jgi:hypothetical protein
MTRLLSTLLLGSLVLVIGACDKTDSFVLSNMTDEEITVQVRVIDTSGRSASLATYLLGPGEVIDTRDAASLDDGEGGVLFSDEDRLVLCAYANNQLIQEDVFTYDDVKSRHHRFEFVGPTNSPLGTDCATRYELRTFGVSRP